MTTDNLVAVLVGRGSETVAMRILSLYLKGSARAWLNNLPEDSIHSWREFEEVLYKNFEGTYKCPGGYQEFMLCVQTPKEFTREYIQRWTHLRNSMEGVTEDRVILAFQQGVRYKHIQLKLG